MECALMHTDRMMEGRCEHCSEFNKSVHFAKLAKAVHLSKYNIWLPPAKHQLFYRDIGMRLCFDYSIVSMMDK